MTNPEVAILMLCLFIFLVLLGFPIAFTLIAMGVGFGYYAYFQGGIETFSDIFNNNIFYLLNQNTYSVMENDTLVAIPLFLFMGYVVERANIVDRLFYSLYMAARNLPGSLAIAALLTCAVFSTASGIVGAVVTLMGLLAYPAMANANYNRSFASGVICAGGTLGILIPPSLPMIVYAVLTENSIGQLFAAGFLPGIIATAPVPFATVLVTGLFYRSLSRGKELAPFLYALALFGLCLVGLGISIWPDLIPARVSIWEAAAPPRSQLFMLVGAVIMVPIILVYTAWAYWVFRGKVGHEGYH